MASQKPAGSATGLRVLVVEDEVMISMLVEDMLTELGHHVVAQATSLAEAASLAAQADFDAALLDVNLNGERVDAIAETLAKRGKPFAFTTGYGERGIPLDFKDRPLLPKPYQMDQLNEILTRVMRPA
ncbi:MAG TPA: response regulator [Xanthobacteraceae bacterium]|nr:response regulator [Xanthobacteraceae bacterium]